MQLIPMVTEIQYNLVNDINDIDTRQAVFRVRINGNIGWLDMLHGGGFFKYLVKNAQELADNLISYGVEYLEAHVSNKVFDMLQDTIGATFPITRIEMVKLVGLNTNHISIKLI